jgi:hypothetical protein
MMLGWIKANFDARIVFIIRHPAAVVLSQMRATSSWDPHRTIERYRKDARLLRSLDSGTKKLLRQQVGDVESFTLTWCIENAVGLRQASEFNIPVIHYEELVDRGEPEWRRILSALELDKMPDVKLVSRPSQQTWGAKATDAELTHQYAGWMDSLDASTAVRIQKILDATGMELYSIAEALPKKDITV